MSRFSRILLFCCLLMAVLLAGGTIWLLSTPTGAQVVLRGISRFSPLQIEAGEIEGRLAGDLRLRQVAVYWPQGEAEAQTLLVRWRPLALLYGKLAVRRLLLEEAVLHLPEAEQESKSDAGDFTFPEIDGLPLRLRAGVDDLRIASLAVRRGEEEMLHIERLQGEVNWDAGVLHLRELDFVGTPGRLTGAGKIDFIQPALALDLRLSPAEAPAEFDTLVAQADLHPADGRRQLTGPLALTLLAQGEERWRLRAELDWRPDRIALTDLFLTRPGLPGEIRGEGAVSAGELWPFDLSLHLAEIDLQAQTGVPTALFGRLVATGNRQGWKGQFNLENRVAGWQKAEVTATFAGDAQALTIGDLEGDWLQGKVQGTLAATWAVGWQVQAALSARNLQPAAIVAEWPGAINFDLQGWADGRTGEGKGLSAKIDGSLHDSTLRGRALTGGLAATLQGEDLRIDRLALRGDGFDLHAAGRLQERIDVRVTVDRLGGLLPEAQGSVRLRGWGGRRQGTIVGEIAARGEKIVWRDLRLGEGSIDAQRQTAGTLVVESDLRGLVWSDYRLDSASVQVHGTLEAHRLRLTTTGSDLQVVFAAAGGYAQGEWAGEVRSLKTDGRLIGPWTLQEPFSLRVGKERLRLSGLRLAGAGEESLVAAGDLELTPLRGWLEAQWRQLDLSRGKPWLSEGELRGRSNGSGRVEWLPDERLAVHGELTVEGSLLRAGYQLQVQQAKARIDGDAGGVRVEAAADLGEFGQVSLSAASPRPAQVAWPAEGSLAARWRLPDLAPLSPWLPDMTLSGASSGEVSGRWWEGGGMEMAGKAEMAGSIRRGTLHADIRRAQTAFAWGGQGLEADWRLDLGPQGEVAGEIVSDVPAQRRLPDRGRLRAAWEKIDLAILRPWLPENLQLAGTLNGTTRGEWFPGQRLRLSGEAHLVGGGVHWREEEGTVAADVQEARLDWIWQEETLAGDLRLRMEDYGQAAGSFRLPLPARWPTAIDPAGPVQAQLRAEAREKGLLNAFFPGLIQESEGKLAADLRLGGTWETPDFGGELQLRDAAAYLPTAGIRLEEVELAAVLAGQQLRITSVQLRSGPGRITGEGEVRLRQWQLDSYQLRLKGDDFRAVHLPEMQLRIAPDLNISGSAKKLTVRGDLRIPALLITERKRAAPIEPSADIVIVDAPAAPERNLPLALDVRVRLILGEHVLVDSEGIDARLEGNLLLTMSGLDPEAITAQGEIRIAQGKYATYGVSLDITRGSILFAGGPVNRPVLDIRAMRKVGEVQAGVRVRGTPREPQVELVSEPAMTDTDTLSYIVLGHPIGQNGGGNAGLLMLAANALLSEGESAVLQDRLKRIFGLDVLEIDAGNGDAQSSQITIGKYLNPDLYISFGQSLFSETNEVRMRYNLSRRWQIESSVGEQSAVDLFYKIEFR